MCLNRTKAPKIVNFVVQPQNLQDNKHWFHGLRLRSAPPAVLDLDARGDRRLNARDKALFGLDTGDACTLEPLSRLLP